MCGPLALAGVAAVAGTALAAKGQQQARDAANQAMIGNAQRRTQIQNAYQAQQQGLMDKANTVVQQTTPVVGADATKAAMQTAASNRLAQYNAADVTDTSLPTADDANKTVKDQLGTVVGKALDRVKSEATAKANLNSFGDVSLGNQLALLNSGNSIDMLNNFRKGDSMLLPTNLAASDAQYDLDTANAANKGQGLRTAGSLIQLAGSLYGGAAAAGALPEALGGAGAGAAGAGNAGWTSWLGSSAPDYAGLDLSIPANDAAAYAGATTPAPSSGGLFGFLSGLRFN